MDELTLFITEELPIDGYWLESKNSDEYILIARMLYQQHISKAAIKEILERLYDAAVKDVITKQ